MATCECRSSMGNCMRCLQLVACLRQNRVVLPWLGPREKQTLSQLWALVQMFDIKNVDFVIKTSDEPSYGKNRMRSGKMYAPLFAWNGSKYPRCGFDTVL